MFMQQWLLRRFQHQIRIFWAAAMDSEEEFAMAFATASATSIAMGWQSGIEDSSCNGSWDSSYNESKFKKQKQQLTGINHNSNSIILRYQRRRVTASK